MCSDTSCWGIPAPHARTGGVLIVAQRRLKLTDTIILRGSANPPTSTGESPFYLEIRERIYMEEEDHFTLSTPSS